MTAGSMRIDVARYHGLESDHQAGRGNDRIDRLLRDGTVATKSPHSDAHDVDGGRDRAGPDDDLARLLARYVVKRKDRIAGESLEQAILDHAQGTALVLLRWLEDQVDRAIEVAAFGEVPGEAKKHGGMPVMTAGMHLAGILRGIGQVCVSRVLAARPCRRGCRWTCRCCRC